MKLVFVSGPYRADTEYGAHSHIQAAEKVALEVWKLGAACCCPHKNTAYFAGALPDQTWLEGDLEILARCDAVMLMDKWMESEGARAEQRRAGELCIPVFTELHLLGEWLDGDLTLPAQTVGPND